MNTLVDFGSAIKALKEGKRVARIGWNDNGMFVFMRPADTCKLTQVLGFKSLPNCFKDYLELENQPITTENEPDVTFNAYLCMKAADGSIVNGWLASQTDILAEDWVILTKNIEL